MLTRRNLLRITAAASLVGKTATGAAARVKAGCQTNAWDIDPARFETLLSALSEIRELGFTGFETQLRYLQPQMNRQEEARAEIASRELTFIGVHTNMPKYEELGEERALEDIGRHAMAAKQFGAKTLIVNSTTSPPPKFIDAAAMRSLEMGVIFALHAKQTEAAALIDQTNAKTVYFMLDLAEGGADFFKNHPSRIYCVHLQNEEGLHELAAAVRHTKWISWLVHEGKSSVAVSRAAMKKEFGV